MSMFEAMQTRVPVIASRIDAILEDVTDGDSALLVSPGDADALTGALADASTNLTLMEVRPPCPAECPAS
jgi:glycosyltransferase involved in cell wall biosynthesis